MPENMFILVLSMSVAASVAAILIIIFRWAFGGRLPKIYSYVLWAVVLLRLLIPLAIPSAFSIFNIIPIHKMSITQEQYNHEIKETPPQGTIFDNINYGDGFEDTQGFDVSEITKNALSSLPIPKVSTDPLHVFVIVASWIWLTGAAGLFLFSLFMYLYTRNRLREAVLYKRSPLTYQCTKTIKLKREVKISTSNYIETPIVHGLIRPSIILPAFFDQDLNEAEIEYIIVHELVHIKRFDYLIKAISLLALCVHWFNPIIWVSFILSQKDMEMSCDESVLSTFGYDIRSDYATSLIRLAAKQNKILGYGLLAFGESDIKSRIKGIKRYKKPKFWVTILAIILLFFLGGALLTNRQLNAPIVDDETQIVIPGALEVTKTICEYKQGHIITVEGRFKSSDNELYLSFCANDVEGGGQLEEGVRKADEIKPLTDGWFSFKHKLIETTGEVTQTKDITIIFHLKVEGRNDKGLLIVTPKQPPSSPLAPKNKPGDIEDTQEDIKGGGERIISRRDRVQGIITEIEIMSDGMIESITLKGTKRIPIPGNPVEYDFTDKIFHIIFDEEIAEAGMLKDKLEKGAEIVVTFAQYAIPADGKNPNKTILGAYLSEIYYVEDGKYYDTQGEEANLIPQSNEQPIEILPIYLEESDGKNAIEGELYYDKDIILRLNTLEITVKAEVEGIDINALKKRYSFIDAWDGVIAIVEKIVTARGESIILEFYEYNAEHIMKIWSSNDLFAQIQNINQGKIELYFPEFNLNHGFQLTKDELNYWEQRVAELHDSGISINDDYYLDIKGNFLIDPVAYYVIDSNDSRGTEIMVLSEISTVGAKTPWIRDEAIIVIKNDNGAINGAINVEDITLKRESAKDETPFTYFNSIISSK